MPFFSPNPGARPGSYNFYLQSYQHGNLPWDTGVVPPELIATVEGPQAMPLGRALDLGCGTGTNSLYLARQGWRVTGIDFVAEAIEHACEKQRHAGSLPGSVRFLVGDVTCLDKLKLASGYTLLFDLGCLHNIDIPARISYAESVTRLSAPHALFLLYGFALNQQSDVSLTQAEVHTLFEPAFALERVIVSPGPPGTTSAWYWLRRVP